MPTFSSYQLAKSAFHAIFFCETAYHLKSIFENPGTGRDGTRDCAYAGDMTVKSNATSRPRSQFLKYRSAGRAAEPGMRSRNSVNPDLLFGKKLVFFTRFGTKADIDKRVQKISLVTDGREKNNQ